MTNRNWTRQAAYDKIRTHGFTRAREDGAETAERFSRALTRRQRARDPVHEKLLDDAKVHREKRAKIHALALKLAKMRAP